MATQTFNRSLFFGTLVVTFLGLSSAYPGGAPDDSGTCSTMFPSGHSVSPQSVASPYTISPSKTTYLAGETITVTISGGTFKGFLLQARLVGQSTPVGTWTAATSTKLTCNNAGITHSNNAANTSVALQWTAPTPSVGHIEFVATVVKVKVEFWVKLKSAQVSDPDPPSVTSSTTTLGPISGPLTIDVSGCGSSKGCFRSESGCSQDTCDYLLTWENSGQSVIFEMSGTPEKPEGYIAMGLSRDKMMGGTSVTQCTASSNGVVKVAQSYNEPRSNSPVTPDQLGLSNTAGHYSGGRISCKFTRQSVINPTNSKVFDLGMNYYIFFALGQSMDGFLLQHSEIPEISDGQVDVTSTSYSDLYGTITVSDLERAHGILMITAWMFCASMAILLARYYKKVWPSNKLCGTAVWFAIHRVLMITNLFCTVAAFIIIFIDAKGAWSKWGISYMDAHPFIGVVITLLVIINPLMAAFRPHPEEPNRRIFNWAHWAVGKSGHILAIINIFIGLNLPTAKVFVDRSALWLVVAFAVFHGVIEIVLEIEKCRHNQPGKKQAMEMTPIGQAGDTAATENEEGAILRPVFGIYAFVAVGIWIAVVLIMALGPL